MRVRSIIILLVVLLVLGGVYFVFSRPGDTEETEPKIYVWDIQDSDITHIKISLPKENLSQSFVKISNEDQFPWFFDDPQNSPVDTVRWGGGIPLILSGPAADRVLTENATNEQLNTFGLYNPNMVITLTLTSKEVMTIDVGDNTPNGYNYYVSAPDSNAVATVDSTWYQVIESLVKNPPKVTTTTTTN